MGKLCQSCNQREAKIHFTELKDGKKTEMHLCEHCAQDKNMAAAFPSLLSTLVKGGSEPSESDLVPAACPGCGLPYAEFKAKGRLGCPQCYTSFAPVLVPLLEKVHSHATHKGRRPKHLPALDPEAKEALQEFARESRDRVQGAAPEGPDAAPPAESPAEPGSERERLRAELREAVDSEDYERAAELRDRIRGLEDPDA